MTNFISVYFFIFFIITLFLYFLFPIKYRWFLLLASSIFFYSSAGVDSLIFLLQATNDLTREEGEDQIERFKALEEALPLEEGKPYDFIIIDNPPDLGLNVINALAVSDDVIVPTKIDAWALEGLDVIIEQVGQMQQLNSRLQFRGVLPTMWQNSDANVSGLEWLQEKGYKVFDSKIWYGAKAAESTFFCKPIVEYAPRSWTAIRYRKFVAEYMAEIGAEKAADLQEGKGVQ